MSKPIKEMIEADYKRRFENVNDAILVDIRGIEANDNNNLRINLLKKDIRVTIVRNNLARRAFQGTKLEALSKGFNGPSALVHGAESVVDVAREIVELAKKYDKLDLKGASLDGEFYEGENGVKALSKFPTRQEAISKVVTLVLSPAQNILGSAIGPSGQIMGIVKEVQERLERGEEITQNG